MVGESVLALSGLETTWESLEEAAQTGSVQLFAAAACRADRSFKLDDGSLEALQRIIALVEGLPLGILLAAAWVDTLHVREIADEIEKSLDFLETDLDGTPDRHRSIRAVFEYSLSLLGKEERRMFSALSIFKGGFTRDAAEHVAGASLRGLSSLAGKSLITADRASGRYSSHELLRQYAEELLRADDALHESTMKAYIEFYSRLGEESERLIVLADQKQALTILEDDLANVRSAFRRSAAQGDGVAVRRLVLALWFLYEVRGWHQAAYAMLQPALESFAEDSDDETTLIARESVAGTLGKFVAYLGQPTEGAAMSQMAAERLSGTSDWHAELMSREARCDGLAYLGDWGEIRSEAKTAIDVADRHGCLLWRAGMPNSLAIAEAQLGNEDAAIVAVDDGHARLAALGDEFFMAWNVMVRATMEAMAGRYDEAAMHNSKLIDLSRGLGFQRTLQFGLQGLGDVKLAGGDLVAAQDAYLECLAASNEMGAVVEVAGIMTRISDVRARMGLEEDAVEVLASVLAHPVSERKMINEASTIGELAIALMDPLEAALEPEVFASAKRRGTAMGLEAEAERLFSV